MIVTRQSFIDALNRQKPGRTGTIEPTDLDATRIWTVARRLLPLIVQAEALFWENGGKVETPKQASMAMALHSAEPEAFDFAGCPCKSPAQIAVCMNKPHHACERRTWIDLVRTRATMPPNVDTPAPPIPQRGHR
jgi:hypothetical protein